MFLPEELVKVTMFHIFKHHDERVALHTHSVEGDNVFMLQVGEKLSLSVEVCPATLTGLFQSLEKKMHKHKDKGHNVRNLIYKNVHLVNKIH